METDFATGGDCYQKVVRFCHDGSKLVTGGTEGVVRVWKVSQCTCVGEFSSILCEHISIVCTGVV